MAEKKSAPAQKFRIVGPADWDGPEPWGIDYVTPAKPHVRAVAGDVVDDLPAGSMRDWLLEQGLVEEVS